MTFGERLKLLRTRKKLSQQALSDRLGLNRSTYARYETNDNQPDYDTLQTLADFFEVTVDYLLGREAIHGTAVHGSVLYSEKQPNNVSDDLSSIKTLTKDKMLQELTNDDPDDMYFLDGYLEASEEEKKEIRRHWLEIKRQMRENKIKPSAPMSLRDFNENLKKSD